MESEAGTRKRNYIEAHKRFFLKKLRNGYVLEAYIHIYIYIIYIIYLNIIFFFIKFITKNYMIQIKIKHLFFIIILNAFILNVGDKK